MIWSPFAGGELFTGTSEQAQRVRYACSDMSDKYGASVDQIALAWLLALPCNPFPVLGTGKTSRLKQAVDALNVKLERQDWFRLLKASRGHGVA